MVVKSYLSRLSVELNLKSWTVAGHNNAVISQADHTIVESRQIESHTDSGCEQDDALPSCRSQVTRASVASLPSSG